MSELEYRERRFENPDGKLVVFYEDRWGTVTVSLNALVDLLELAGFKKVEYE